MFHSDRNARWGLQEQKNGFCRCWCVQASDCAGVSEPVWLHAGSTLEWRHCKLLVPALCGHGRQCTGPLHQLEGTPVPHGPMKNLVCISGLACCLRLKLWSSSQPMPVSECFLSGHLWAAISDAFWLMWTEGGSRLSSLPWLPAPVMSHD